jgi:hypothetical protein
MLPLLTSSSSVTPVTQLEDGDCGAGNSNGCRPPTPSRSCGGAADARCLRALLWLPSRPGLLLLAPFFRKTRHTTHSPGSASQQPCSHWHAMFCSGGKCKLHAAKYRGRGCKANQATSKRRHHGGSSEFSHGSHSSSSARPRRGTRRRAGTRA